MDKKELRNGWMGKKKAVTLSYDDGVVQDIRLIALLDKYGLKCTFNLIPARQSRARIVQKPPITVQNLDMKELPSVYAHHEVAGHTWSHPHLERLTDEEIFDEIYRCQDTLSQLFSRPIYGMAYPYGTYDERVVRAAQKCGVQYARTCVQTYDFSVSDALLTLPTTCRHAAPQLLRLAEDFVALSPDEPCLFYLWGHSYEFDQFDQWELMEEFCKIISRRDDIFYGTNSEVLLGKSQV